MKLACSYNVQEVSKQEGAYYKLGRGANYVWTGVWSAIAMLFTWGELGYSNTVKHQLRDRAVVKVAAPLDLSEVPLCNGSKKSKSNGGGQFCKIEHANGNDYYQLPFRTMMTNVKCHGDESEAKEDGYTLELDGHLTYPSPSSLMWQDGTWVIGIHYVGGKLRHVLDKKGYEACKADKACMLYEPKSSHHPHKHQ
jgi:hypothetical protein